MTFPTNIITFYCCAVLPPVQTSEIEVMCVEDMAFKTASIQCMLVNLNIVHNDGELLFVVYFFKSYLAFNAGNSILEH